VNGFTPLVSKKGYEEERRKGGKEVRRIEVELGSHRDSSIPQTVEFTSESTQNYSPRCAA
jgi:hypothetical protein